MKYKSKDLIMIGMIVGIGLFFIGAMINNSFPSDSENLTPYKISAFIKMLGIGALTTSMIIGGIIIEKIDKNLKMLLFIFGLVLLIIYTIGSIDLAWHVDSPVSGSLNEETKEEIEDSAPEGYGASPGFEIIGILLSLGLISFLYKKRYKR